MRSAYTITLWVMGLLLAVGVEIAAASLDAADSALRTGDYGRAASLLSAALERDPTNLNARLLSLTLAEITGDQASFERQVDFFFEFERADKAEGNAMALTAVARGVQHEDPHGAWRAYQMAQQADPDYIDAYIFAGEHCLDTYAWGLAEKQFGAVLEHEKGHSEACAGLASLNLQMGHLEHAEAWSIKALENNAESMKAREVRAALHALDDSFEDSLTEIQSMLGINSNDLRALSLLAACSDAMGKTEERDQALDRIRGINVTYAGAYLELAKTSSRRRQVPAAVDWAEKAIEANPEDWEGYYLAGTALLHAGEEKRGYALLQEAFTRNEFNVWAYNLLHVLDRDLGRNEFIYHSTPHFFVKLDRTESDILWPYLETMLEEMYEKQTRKYEFEPRGPEEYDGKILVSTFPSHDEFSARTVGLPGMDASGACLGSVITMVSPRAMQRRSTPINWRGVLEHELLHVITLQKTDYRIPRWFTEGLSTYEERDAQRHLDPVLVWALAENKLLPLERLNVGFHRPSFQSQIPLSYYHASLICAYFEETLEFPSILAMLDGYAAGRSTEEILLSVSGKGLHGLNRDIQTFVRLHAEQIKIPPPLSDKRMRALEEATHTDTLDADEWVDLASRYMLDCNAEEARKAAERAIEADSGNTRAKALQAHIAYTLDKDPTRAEKLFNEVKKADADFFSARFYLGIIARENDKTQEAIREFEASRQLYPRFHSTDNSPYTALVELYEETEKPEQAIGVLSDLIAIDRGLSSAHRKLGELLLAQGRPEQAAAAFMEAIHINPFLLELHELAANAFAKAGNEKAAMRERKVAQALASAGSR